MCHKEFCKQLLSSSHEKGEWQQLKEKPKPSKEILNTLIYIGLGSANMANPRRKFEHNALYMITNRLAEGLPLVANDYINTLIYSVLARTQEAVPDIEICNFQFMANHYHGFIIPRKDPQDVSKFLNMLDGELAKFIQKLLGRRNSLVWAQRAHAAQILDYEAALKEISYSFLNPSCAHLVDSIDEWRGVSSWSQMFFPAQIQTIAIYPSHIDKIPNRPFRCSDVSLRMESLSALKLRPLSLILKPFGFKSCFAASANLTDEQIRNRILALVRTGEKKYRKERAKLKRAPLGPHALAEQNPYKTFKPKTFGRRVFCISTDHELRRLYIEAYHAFCKLCKQAWQKLRQGLCADYPPAAFIPSLAPRANILPLPL